MRGTVLKPESYCCSNESYSTLQFQPNYENINQNTHIYENVPASDTDYERSKASNNDYENETFTKSNNESGTSEEDLYDNYVFGEDDIYQSIYFGNKNKAKKQTEKDDIPENKRMENPEKQEDQIGNATEGRINELLSSIDEVIK